MNLAEHPHELTGLLRAIIADPNNDLPRLTYARHLEKDGVQKERALLIRVQIAVAKLPSSDHPEWLRLASIARRLEMEKGIEWIPNWYGPEGIREVQFHRGFIECVTVRGAALLEPKTRRRLLDSAPVRHFNIVELEGDHDLRLILDGFLSDGAALRVMSLNLDGQNLTDESIKHLGQYGLKNLRWLSLAHNRIGELGVRALAEDSISDWDGLRSLMFVNLEGNKVNPIDRVYEDQGVVVGQRTTKLRSYLPNARWLRRDVIAGRVLQPDRFALASGGLANSATLSIAAQ